MSESNPFNKKCNLSNHTYPFGKITTYNILNIPVFPELLVECIESKRQQTEIPSHHFCVFQVSDEKICAPHKIATASEKKPVAFFHPYVVVADRLFIASQAFTRKQ